VGSNPTLSARIPRQRRRRGMEEFDVRGQRLAALCLLGLVLFSYPVLAVFNVQGTIAGIPVLYAYFFLAWGALIALMALVIERPD
jgi:hypothetical protein